MLGEVDQPFQEHKLGIGVGFSLRLFGASDRFERVICLMRHFVRFWAHSSSYSFLDLPNSKLGPSRGKLVVTKTTRLSQIDTTPTDADRYISDIWS